MHIDTYTHKLSSSGCLCSQNSLVRLLSAKERDHVRSVFMGLDLDKDSVVTGAETRWAQQSWFQKLSKESQSCNVR